MRFCLWLGVILSLYSPERSLQYTKDRELITLNGKLFIDTTWNSTFKPDSIFVYYYNVRSKYPESSESIRNDADSYLLQSAGGMKGSGYITYKFFIDSLGQMQKRIQVLQTNELYKAYRFSDQLIWLLYDYLSTLRKWKPAKAPAGYPPFYIGIITFKFHEDKLVAVIP